MRRQVDTLGQAVRDSVAEALRLGAERVAEEARGRVLAARDEAGPSELAESVAVAEADGDVHVVARAAHAPFVEFGTRAAAQPFLGPALAVNREIIVEECRAAVRAVRP